MHRSGAGTVAGSLAIWAAACVAMATLGTRDVGARAGASPAPQIAVAQGVAAQPAATPPAPQAGYAGDDTCLTCHTDQAALAKTPHGRVSNPRAPAAKQGCETCHGPGQAHVDDDAKGHIIRFTKMAAREVNETCVTCHTRGQHALWSGSQHDARNLSCTTCHSVHAPKSTAFQLKAVSEVALCATCHTPQVLKMNRSAHMPVREGKMTCSSCHNPHGATNVRLLKTGNWINESCATCHAEKRGPFLYEHAAGRESCVSCHDPHGSSNERMLVAKVPMLCQRCHIGTRHPSTIYDGAALTAKSSRLIGRGCVNCHSNIHGSNHPSGSTFLR